MRKSFFLFLACVLCLFACNLLYPSAKLIGKWQCVAWEIDGKPGNYNIEQTKFNFKENDYYEATISGHAEKGAFYVEGDKLMTTAEGAMQIITMIDKVTKDSLVLQMNREGASEKMILIKQSSGQ